MPACNRFRRTIRTNPAGAANACSGRFECPAYDARVAANPTTNAANAATASASLACAARLRTGANRDPLSPGPASSETGTVCRDLGSGFDFGGSGRRGASGRERTPGTREDRFLLFAIYPARGSSLERTPARTRHMTPALREVWMRA
jgi:hypothetical protein